MTLGIFIRIISNDFSLGLGSNCATEGEEDRDVLGLPPPPPPPPSFLLAKGGPLEEAGVKEDFREVDGLDVLLEVCLKAEGLEFRFLLNSVFSLKFDGLEFRFLLKSEFSFKFEVKFKSNPQVKTRKITGVKFPS